MLYVSSMVLLPLLAWKVSRLPWPGGVKAAVCAAVVVLGSAGYVVAGRIWNDDRGLFETLAREAPLDADTHEDLADCYHHRANQPDVADSTRRRWLVLSGRHTAWALQLDGNRPLSWFILGRTAVELGRDSLGVVALERGLRLKEDSKARFVLAQALTRLGRLSEAESSAVRVLSRPDGRRDPEAWADLGWIHFKQHRFRESVWASTQALLLNPELRLPAYNRALAWACAGRTDSAEAGYRATLAGDPDGADAEAALTDIVDLGTAKDPGATAAARAFLRAAEPGGADSGPQAPLWMPRLRAALDLAERKWPGLTAVKEGVHAGR
jgi:tetratricopeptide (TPR) repeat protein